MGVLLVEHDMELVMRVCTQHQRPRLRRRAHGGDPRRGAGRRAGACRLPGVGRRSRGRGRGAGRRSRRADEAGTELAGRPVAERPAVLELRRVHAAYGQIEVLHGIDLAVANGVGAGAARTERGGQVDDAARGQRADGADEGVLPRARAPRQRHAARQAGPRRAVHLPDGRGIFPNLTVDREPPPDDLRRAVPVARGGDGVRPVPPAGGAAPPGGGHAVGWRAADAGHGAHAERGAGRPPARRDLHGPGADDRRRALRDWWPRSPPRAWRSSWPSSSPPPRSAWPPTSPSSCRAGSSASGKPDDLPDDLADAYLGGAAA